MDYLNSPVGQIAAQLPGATGVFQKYGIDFCCGGKNSLQQLVQKKQLDGAMLVRDLIALEKDPLAEKDWNTIDLLTLVDHIYRDFHERHREQLPELIRLAQRVESVHGDRADCPDGLSAVLKEMRDELELHMQKEECVLFPLIRSGRGPDPEMVMGAMECEHEEHGRRLDRLRAAIRNGVPPADACNTWRALYSGTKAFIDDVMEHIHLENNVLFPRVRAG